MRLFTLTLATTIAIGAAMAVIGGQAAEGMAQRLDARQQAQNAAIEALLD